MRRILDIKKRRILILVSLFFVNLFIIASTDVRVVSIDATQPTNKVFTNIASNINVWQMGGTFINPKNFDL